MDYDFLVLIAAVLYGIVNLWINLWIYKKQSLYQMIISGIVYFYSLFVFTATNNVILTIAFLMILILPKYISYKKGVFAK